MRKGGRRNGSCVRCGADLETTDEECFACGFNPRSGGLKIAMTMLLGAVSLVLLAAVAVYVAPWAGVFLVGAAFVLVPLAAIVLIASFVVTPGRLDKVWRR